MTNIMKTRLLISTTALAVALATAGCNKSSKLNTPSTAAPPAGPVELKLKWTPGEHMVQEFSMDQTMLMNIPGMAEPMKQDMTMGQRFSITVVNAEADGSHELEMKFLGAHVAMEMGKMSMNYDSDKDSVADATNPLTKVMAQIIGSKIQYFLDASNNVERIEGLKELRERISTGDRMGVMRSMFNEDYFKRMMSLNQFLPPNAVQPGDSWPAEIQFPMGPMGTMDVNYHLTFKGWEKSGERNCARIEMTGDIKTEPGGSAGPMGMTMTIPKGTVTGVLWFDPEFGTAINSQMNQDMTMIMTMPKRTQPGMGGGAGPTQSITNQLSQVINFKVDSLE